MTVAFLASLIGGILLAVRVMILGVERPREAAGPGERLFRLSPPMIVAFAVVFGAAGYLFTRRSVSGPIGTILLAAGLGAVASVAAARLVSKWSAVTPEHEVGDERYVLQGHLARVLKPIASGGEGEVTFDIGSGRRVIRARSVDNFAVGVDTDVVIERIEDDVAYVERWLEVEKRL